MKRKKHDPTKLLQRLGIASAMLIALAILAPASATFSNSSSAQLAQAATATQTLVPLHRYYNGVDHMSLTRDLSAEEQAYTTDNTMGYVSSETGAGLVPLYSCIQAGHTYNHMPSLDPLCEGNTMQELVGYVWSESAPDRMPRYRCLRHPYGTYNDHYFSTAADCKGKGGPTGMVVYVAKGPGTENPSCELESEPLSITRGESSTLSWTTENAESITINKGIGEVSDTAVGSIVVSPAVTTTYTATVRGAGKTAQCATTVSVELPLPAFSVGDTVRATARVAVRAEPALGAERLGVKASGSTGVVVDGPTPANNFLWWKISWPPAPGSRALTLEGWSVQNYLELSAPDLPTITIEATDGVANEGANTGSFSISRTGSTASALAVTIALSGTATRNVDYTLSGSGIIGNGTTLSIPATTASTIVTLTGNTDTLSEGSETATMTIVNKPAYEVGSPSSADIRINDSGAPDTTKPTVTLTNPAAGETIKNIITLRATSTDDTGVVDVAWKIGNTEIARATSTNQVFSARWDTKSVTNGTTTLRAVARDAAGNIATSSPVNVAVSNETTPPKFANGDRVEVTTLRLIVRDAAGGTRLGVQKLGAQGKIASGPIKKGAYTWWEVDWDLAPDGWVAEDFLEDAPAAATEFKIEGLTYKPGDLHNVGTNIVVYSDPWKAPSHTLTATLGGTSARIGFDDKGGGYIMNFVLDGFGMPGVDGYQVAIPNYGRGWQGSSRSAMHTTGGGMYNPTQAGYTDVYGAPVEVIQSADSVLVPQFQLPLYYNGVPNIDHRIRSEYDFSAKTTDATAKYGILAFEHQQYYAYVRPPHAMTYFSIVERNRAKDISPGLPGKQPATDIDISSNSFTPMGLRLTQQFQWVHYRMDGEWVSKSAYSAGFYGIACRIKGSGPASPADVEAKSDADEKGKTDCGEIDVPLMVLSTSQNPGQGIGVGLYYPQDDPMNKEQTRAIDSTTLTEIRRENRSEFSIMTQEFRAGFFSIRSRSFLTGMFAPETATNHYGRPSFELLTNRTVILVGTPAEILNAVQSHAAAGGQANSFVVAPTADLASVLVANAQTALGSVLNTIITTFLRAFGL